MTKYRQAERLADSIRDNRVREAFMQVDRSRFVPAELQMSAWADHPLPIDDGATISQPSLVAEMTEWLEIEPEHRILEIGTGSGYQTAILAELAQQVYSVEISNRLSQTATLRLDQLGYSNIHLRVGDGAKGWPEAAPFDRILATVAFPRRPEALLAQLNEGGLAIAPIGPPAAVQQLMRYERTSEGITEVALIPVRFLGLR